VFEGKPYDMLDAALADAVGKFPIDIQVRLDPIRSDPIRLAMLLCIVLCSLCRANEKSLLIPSDPIRSAMRLCIVLCSLCGANEKSDPIRSAVLLCIVLCSLCRANEKSDPIRSAMLLCTALYSLCRANEKSLSIRSAPIAPLHCVMKTYTLSCEDFETHNLLVYESNLQP
jgi:hypothetical protein